MRAFFISLLESSEDGMPAAVGVDQIVIPAMRRFCMRQTAFLIENKGLNLDDLSHFLLQRAVAAALQRASLKMRGVEEGTTDPQDFAQMTAKLRKAAAETPPPLQTTKVSSALTTLTSLFDLWWAEAQAAGRSESTYQSYRSTLRSFVSFVGHEDPSRIAAADVIAFKDFRLHTPSPKTGKKPSAKTVKDSDLAALKAVFGWAANNRLMSQNPAAGITIKLGKRPKFRPKGFTDAEAISILRATLGLLPGAELPTTAAAKRWVPWLCALTGGRVGEMLQLRKQDVRFEKGFWIIHVTPEAGTVKTNEARDVVLHRQIIAQGFPDFVATSAEGHLFVRVGESGEVQGPLKGLRNRLGEFVRTIVTDINVHPNHAWRHYFKTTGREAGIDEFVLNTIQGHAPRTEGEKYGDVSLKTIAAAIAAYPEIDLEMEVTQRGASTASDGQIAQESHPALPPQPVIAAD